MNNLDCCSLLNFKKSVYKLSACYESLWTQSWEADHVSNGLTTLHAGADTVKKHLSTVVKSLLDLTANRTHEEDATQAHE